MSSKEEEEEGGANVIEATLEKTFEDLGRSVARYPLAFIGFSLALTTIFSLGTLALKDESRPDKQWVPEGSPSLSAHVAIHRSKRCSDGHVSLT